MSRLLSPEIQQFIKDHERHDPVALILKHKEIHEVPAKTVVEQITARQKAKTKLPEWYAAEGLIFPSPISMEQCSSEVTADYKAALIRGGTLIDLTGGAGVDTYYFSKYFKNVTYVEQNEELTKVTAHNLKALGATNVTCKNARAEKFLKNVDQTDVIYLDPARRDENAQRVFRFEDCEPNILELLPELLDKTETILVKASPMLDIDLSVKDLQHVHEIHVISVDNECKEVLYLLGSRKVQEPKIVTVNLRRNAEVQKFSFYRSDEAKKHADCELPQQFLYEANSAVLKAGAFQSIARAFNLNKLHLNTHLYTCNEERQDFPGRHFRILDVVPYNKKAVAAYLPDKKANITTRNFPDEVKTIKKKLNIKDGGDKYLFAFTDKDGNKRIAITVKL